MNHSLDALPTALGVNLPVPGAKAADRQVDHTLHLMRLADAMTAFHNGVPMRAQDWVYEGQVADAGPMWFLAGNRCTCTHPIRYIFTIRNSVTDATLPIGSVCIETSVPYLIAQGAGHLAEALQAALAALREAITEATRRERDARNDVVANVLLTYAGDLEYFRRSMARRERLLDGWVSGVFYKPFKVNVNSTPGRTISGARRKIEGFIAEVEAAAAERTRKGYRDADDYRSYPKPPPEAAKDFVPAPAEPVEVDLAAVRAIR